MAEHYGAQTKARKAALDILFAAELRDQGLIDTLNETRSLGEATLRDLTTQIVRGVAEYKDTIDQRIQGALKGGWTMARMPRVDRNLARIATFELGYTDTAASAVISEAVRLASDLSTDDSAKFLNGLLKTIAKSTESPETQPNAEDANRQD